MPRMPQTPELAPLRPGALPVIGHALEYRRDPLAFLLRTAAYGRAIRMKLGPIDAVLLREPEDLDQICVGESRKFQKDRMTRGLVAVLGEGLLTSHGDVWLRHRRLLAPAFHRDRVATYAADMVQATERYAAEIRHGETRDLHLDMMGLTLEIVARVLFASDVVRRARDVSGALEILVEHFGDGLPTLFPIMEKLPLPSRRRAHEALATLDDVLLGVVRERRRAKSGGGDLLSMLIEAQDDAGKGLSDRELRDELMTLFLAGHETTALALSFACVFLSRNPFAEEKVRAELAAVLGDRSATADDYPKLVYTRAVVLETMRLHPPVWAIGREAIEDVVIGGYLVPKGQQVWLSQWVNHRDVRYFPEPERFLPERWLDGLEKSLPRFAYYPFSGGPRICIGNTFATMEAVLLLATILRRFRLSLEDKRPLKLSPLITLRPSRPIRVTFERAAP